MRIYRDQCPEIKQRSVDKVSDTDIRQAIASMVTSPGGNCDVLQDLADNDPPPGWVWNGNKSYIAVILKESVSCTQYGPYCMIYIIHYIILPHILICLRAYIWGYQIFQTDIPKSMTFI